MTRRAIALAGAVLLVGCPDPRFVAIDVDAANDVAPGSDAETPSDDAVDAAADAADAAADGASTGGCTIEPSWLDRVQILQAPAGAQPGGWFSRDLLLHEGELFVGSPSEQAVYRYTVDDGGMWTQAQRIAAPRAADNFGLSLSAAGDRLAVGCLDEAGGAWVFERGDDGNWTVDHELRIPGDADPLFGREIAIASESLVVNDSRVTWGYRYEDGAYEPVSSISLESGVAMSGGNALIGDPENIDFEFRTVGGFAEFDLSVRPLYSLVDTQFVDDLPVVTEPLGDTIAATDDWTALSSCGSRHIAVFERNGRAWQQVSLVGVHSPNAEAGCELAIDPQGWLVSGGPKALGLLTPQSGAFGLYQRTEAGWGLARLIQPAIEVENGFFGSDVAIDWPWVAVGSLGPADGSDDDRGMVTMYRFSASCPAGFHGLDCTFRCDDGVRNGGETDVDDGGPCVCGDR